MENCMRSAETSGAVANGFGAANGIAETRQPQDASPANRWTVHLDFSPITATVALTSLLAVLLFVAHDVVRTFEDVRREMASISTAEPETMIAPQAISQAGLLATDIATQHVELSLLEQRHAAAWTQITQRGGLATALALLMTLLTWRRGQSPASKRREHYATLAAAIPMGVACWTETGKLVVCNDQYRSRLNLTKSCATYHEAVTLLISGGYMKMLREDDSNRLLELHRKDGSCLLIDERPLADGGFMTLVSDVTERKKADTLLNAIREEQRLLARRYHEEKLKAEAASRSKTNFLAHLSHDIRTPLNHIIGFAELMKHQTYGPLGDTRYEDYVDSIKQSGEHLLTSFATILDLAELESGQTALRSEPVPLDNLLSGLTQRFRGQAIRAGVTFVVGEDCGAVVMGDKLGLDRMVGNIIENSLRFTPAGGRVTLAAFAARDGVVIEITDTGIGMSEERLASLSQPFALGDATFTREGIGPGLGISIARAIAQLSGGHLAIDSSPSFGTTVAISLPLRDETMLRAA
jgi:two-component system cell cycle sensor histidine kinase PleC